MIFDSTAMPLFEKYIVARETESVATKELLSSMQSGNNDMHILGELTDRMTDAHNRAMDIWDQLQPFALGK